MRLLTAARSRRLGAALLSFAILGGLASPAQAADLPPGPSTTVPAPNPVDAYSTYVPQTTCDPTVKPGAQAVLNLTLAYYQIGRNSGIVRACNVGGTSEHKEGRAFDWGLNVNNPREKAAGDAYVHWLTAPGPDGKVGWNARRLGVMYVIWNRQIWNNTSANATWKPYTGESPHTDHVHVSLSWSGANLRTSWWTGVALPTESDSRRYVTNVYRDLFGRSPDPQGMQTWTAALTSGTPRVNVANAITYSAEYRMGLINGAYKDFLGRTADPGGMQTWLNAMNGGMHIQTMESGFLASPEYYAKSNNDNAQWVRQLYRHVLGRDASEGEVQGWVGTLDAGASRQQVAMGFLISTERLSTVVNGYYQNLLRRGIDPTGQQTWGIDPTGQQTWVSAIQGGARSEDIIGGIIASPEYYGKTIRA